MKKLIFYFLISLTLLLPLSALPGFTPYLLDNDGDYVFYKDKSFNRESYVGILRYNENSYQVRYYAPADMNQKLPEKNIQILFTVDSSLDYFNMTGENIISQILPETEDVDLVNYLHDILYEFSSRRIKIDPVEPSTEGYKTKGSFWENGLKTSTDFPLFGGTVFVQYDCLVPLFNVKNISDAEGKDIFTLETFGTLASSSDFSFDNFKGIPKTKEVKNVKQKNIKGGKSTEYEVDGRKIYLDSHWTQSMENLWFFEDSAMVSASKIPLNENVKDRYDLFVIRRLLMSTFESYADASSISVKSEKGGYKLTSTIYQYTDDNVVRNVKLLKKRNDGAFDFTMFSIFQNEYAAMKKYIESYISKNQ
ncbi:MAG: hypothetical protein HUK25_10040 [Treponema sp.]|nr:hypothetical protein [Treponema sp.]